MMIERCQRPDINPDNQPEREHQTLQLDTASKVALFGYVFVEAIVIAIFIWKTLARH
jgi:hypothetical protein